MKIAGRKIENFLPEYAADDIVALIQEYKKARWWWQRRHLERMAGQIAFTYMK